MSTQRLVTRLEHGYYEIDDPGEQYLEGDLTADDLVRAMNRKQRCARG
ncbi:hypothetical protein [Natrinema ejinorense]|nr:hypothetical protein [Natrinema ejinorense]